MYVRLKRRGWLYCSLEVETPKNIFDVEYNGRGLGYESVIVEGQEVARQTSFWWFVPAFDFFIESYPARLEVEVWP